MRASTIRREQQYMKADSGNEGMYLVSAPGDLGGDRAICQFQVHCPTKNDPIYHYYGNAWMCRSNKSIVNHRRSHNLLPPQLLSGSLPLSAACI